MISKVLGGFFVSSHPKLLATLMDTVEKWRILSSRTFVTRFKGKFFLFTEFFKRPVFINNHNIMMINCEKPLYHKILDEWEDFPEIFSFSPTTLHVSVLYDWFSLRHLHCHAREWSSHEHLIYNKLLRLGRSWFSFHLWVRLLNWFPAIRLVRI